VCRNRDTERRSHADDLGPDIRSRTDDERAAPAYLANGNAGEPQPPGSDEVVLTFRGQIDGGDQIEITDSQAVWRHTHWDLPPEPVMLNGISWDPRVTPPW
jgi:hypothetical protein